MSARYFTHPVLLLTKSLQYETLQESFVFGGDGLVPLRFSSQHLDIRRSLRVEVEVDDVHHGYALCHSQQHESYAIVEPLTLGQLDRGADQQGEDHVALRLPVDAEGAKSCQEVVLATLGLLVKKLRDRLEKACDRELFVARSVSIRPALSGLEFLHESHRTACE